MVTSLQILILVFFLFSAIFGCFPRLLAGLTDIGVRHGVDTRRVPDHAPSFAPRNQCRFTEPVWVHQAVFHALFPTPVALVQLENAPFQVLSILSWWILIDCPALYLQLNACRPCSSTVFPHQHLWPTQARAPRRKAVEIALRSWPKTSRRNTLRKRKDRMSQTERSTENWVIWDPCEGVSFSTNPFWYFLRWGVCFCPLDFSPVKILHHFFSENHLEHLAKDLHLM